MRVEYELDQWEWQGTTRSIEIDPDDYTNMSADEIKGEIYAEIKRDAIDALHLVYAEDEVAREIIEANAQDSQVEEGEAA